jgi:hypothetical protein
MAINYTLLILLLILPPIFYLFYSNYSKNTLEGFRTVFLVKPTDKENDDRFVKVMNETSREEYKRIHTNIRSYQL